ncbi:MAG: triose-phosphate isomerase [Alphaproteobacteria bacterium]|nr:triose-phosphate isomerase [Alphaproteobacteria bacterium]
MKARKPLIAGNWKMNGTLHDGVKLAADLATRMSGAKNKTPFDMAVCPPFTLIARIGEALAGASISLGAQDCHAKEKGAHTGDVSAKMLTDLGCRYVIVGHSERRTDHKETDAQVQAKAQAVQDAGVCAIVCVGETEAEKDAGKTLDVVGRQIAGSVPKGSTAANLVVAYEPVWAIGTGRTPTTPEVAEVHARIRALLGKQIGPAEAEKTRILYGGSMKPSNAAELLALADVDGGLIGGASLVAADFWAIGDAAAK